MSGNLEVDGVRDVVFVSTYVPRKCGIGTFTNDLLMSMREIAEGNDYKVVALNDNPDGYNYPPEVAFEVNQYHIGDYHRAAEYVNFSDAEIVSIQHEFGIFGGKAGNFLFAFLSNIRKPVVTTMHTILRDPPKEYFEATKKLIDYSNHLVVMSKTGEKILKEVYGVSDKKISFIHHGAPDVPFVDPNYYKAKFNLLDRFVILTFGLISPGKGIEFLIDSLPDVVKKHPEVLYIVLGATHPDVKRKFGESYRMSLERRVRDLGLENNVAFYNYFVTREELIEYMSAADVYVTPYPNKEQITSGTLAYAVAFGKAIISTPYWYAVDMLSDDKGILVEYGDVRAMSEALLKLIEDDVFRNQLRKRVYDTSRDMTWNRVAERYLEVFSDVLKSRTEKMEKTIWRVSIPPQMTLPDVNLSHIKRLTDDVGIFQHAAYGIPDRDHGYSADDVGRALAVIIRTYDEEKRDELLPLITTYMSFLKHAQTEDGRFHNFMGYDRRFTDDVGSEDTLGRVVWGLGFARAYGPTEGIRALAQSLLEKSLEHIESLEYPRAKAYAIGGLYEILSAYPGASKFRRVFEKLAEDLLKIYKENSDTGWEWFEDVVTYGNAKLPHALLQAYFITEDDEFKNAGIESLEFLTRIQFTGSYFDFVGNQGWYPRGGKKAIFGQQPIEAGYMTEAYVAAYRATENLRYISLAQMSFEWFLGRNRLGEPLYDFSTGAVNDGIDPQGVSANQGAESVISFLLGLLALESVEVQSAKDGRKIG